MDLNTLKQYMDFYQQNGLAGPRTGWDSTVLRNEPGMAADWAMRAMNANQGGQINAPNFFGGSMPNSSQGPVAGAGYAPSQYTPPQQFQGRFQPPQGVQQPLTGQVNNYLSRIIGRQK